MKEKIVSLEFQKARHNIGTKHYKNKIKYLHPSNVGSEKKRIQIENQFNVAIEFFRKAKLNYSSDNLIDISESINKFEQILKKDSSFFLARIYLAEAYLLKGEYQKTLQHINIGLNIKNSNLIHRNYNLQHNFIFLNGLKVHALVGLHQYEEAVEVAEKMKEKDSNDPSSLRHLIFAYSEQIFKQEGISSKEKNKLYQKFIVEVKNMFAFINKFESIFGPEKVEKNIAQTLDAFHNSQNGMFKSFMLDKETAFQHVKKALQESSSRLLSRDLAKKVFDSLTSEGYALRILKAPAKNNEGFEWIISEVGFSSSLLIYFSPVTPAVAEKSIILSDVIICTKKEAFTNGVFPKNKEVDFKLMFE